MVVLEDAANHREVGLVPGVDLDDGVAHGLVEDGCAAGGKDGELLEVSPGKLVLSFGITLCGEGSADGEVFANADEKHEHTSGDAVEDLTAGPLCHGGRCSFWRIEAC